MPSYETLDLIADSYTPLLALACLGFLLGPLMRRQWQVLGVALSRVVGGALIAYGLMFLDHWFQLWPAMGLDYSTHTAVALVLVMFLIGYSQKARWLWPASLLGYVLLMMVQCYHTLADIGTTGVVVALLYLPFIFPRYRNHDSAAGEQTDIGCT